jgi:hypothetical protein
MGAFTDETQLFWCDQAFSPEGPKCGKIELGLSWRIAIFSR